MTAQSNLLTSFGYILSVLCISACLNACRTEVPVITPEQEQRGTRDTTPILGFYLLNEGNMGSNKATLDYYDFQQAAYHRNIYAQANPNVPKELGDVGNDIQIYGNRLYAVINCSNKVEVMDAATCRRIGQVDIPNCRYIRFKDQYAYVTSYAGPVSLDKSHAQIGYVARFDTATLELIDRCLVGYQPDELAVVGDKLYVANSGGYMVPDYDSTLSVIDLNSFTEIKRITVAKNLHRVRLDNHGQLWVTARGDYFDEPSRLYCIDPTTDQVIDKLPVGAANLSVVGDTLYCFSSDFSYYTYTDSVVFSTVNTLTHAVSGLALQMPHIAKPYGLAVHPITRDIYLTDAKDYVSPGTLHCFAPDGTLRWSVTTGDIPAHITFLRQ